MDMIGWLGAALVLSAYFLVSTRRLDGDSAPFQWLNLVGGVGLLVNTLYYRAFPSSLVNLVWIIIAVVTLMRGDNARLKIKRTRNDDH
jgi:phosphoglycerol transferase MdoB-like AlkP superfamily enzyme